MHPKELTFQANININIIYFIINMLTTNEIIFIKHIKHQCVKIHIMHYRDVNMQTPESLLLHI